MTLRADSRHACYEPTRCDLCDASAAELLLDRPAGSMTSDSRCSSTPLRKVACLGCGLVRNALPTSGTDLQTHYVDDYTLGQQATVAEPLFFTPSGTKPRSQVVFEWMEASVTPWLADAPRSVVEVGCGEGSLLARLAARWPDAAVCGIDMHPASIALARQKGLTATCGSYRDVDGRHDLIVSFAVIEHVPSPRDFLAYLADHLQPNGLLVVAQPCQDRASFDLFFSDHLYHFSSQHLKEFGARAGLQELHRLKNHPAMPEFSLHVFARQADMPQVASDDAPKADVRSAVRQWNGVFERLDGWLRERDQQPISVWGVGQMFTFLSIYTSLGAHRIAAAYDDNPGRFPPGSFPFPVSRFLDAPAPGTAGEVLLTFRPSDAVQERLRRSGRTYFSPLSE